MTSINSLQIRIYCKCSSIPVADSLAVWSDVLRHTVGFQEMPVFAPIPVGDVSVRRLHSSRRLPRSSLATKIEIKLYC